MYFITSDSNAPYSNCLNIESLFFSGDNRNKYGANHFMVVIMFSIITIKLKIGDLFDKKNDFMYTVHVFMHNFY